MLSDPNSYYNLEIIPYHCTKPITSSTNTYLIYFHLDSNRDTAVGFSAHMSTHTGFAGGAVVIFDTVYVNANNAYNSATGVLVMLYSHFQTSYLIYIYYIFVISVLV